MKFDFLIVVVINANLLWNERKREKEKKTNYQLIVVLVNRLKERLNTIYLNFNFNYCVKRTQIMSYLTRKSME